MGSNSVIAIDDGKSHVAANRSKLPNRAIDTANDYLAQREVGDHVNRFLLCALVSESAKRIKTSAGKMGETLPMTMIVRGVLSSYLRAAKDKYGPLAGSELDIDGLRRLNAHVLSDEIARPSQERAKNSSSIPSKTAP
jgi:hypothetical protein